MQNSNCNDLTRFVQTGSFFQIKQMNCYCILFYEIQQRKLRIDQFKSKNNFIITFLFISKFEGFPKGINKNVKIRGFKRGSKQRGSTIFGLYCKSLVLKLVSFYYVVSFFKLATQHDKLASIYFKTNIFLFFCK